MLLLESREPDDLTDMYVTTPGGQDKQTNGESAGALFRLPGISRGLPEFRSRIVAD